MAIAYKGFELWIAEQDGTQIQYIQDVQLSIVTVPSTLPSSVDRVDLAYAISAIDSQTTERANIKTFGIFNGDNQYGYMVDLIPNVKRVPLLTRYSGKYIKLLHPSTGYYMLSASAINSAGRYSSVYKYYLADGTHVGDISNLKTTGNDSTMFIGIPNFDGTVPDTGTMYIYGAYLYSTDPKYTLFENLSVQGLSLNAARAAWWNRVVYVDGYAVTYGMSGCTGDPDNPTSIPAGGSITATFTPNEGKAFSDDSVTVSSVNPVEYTWVPSTGTLTITSATSAVSVLVRGYDGYAVAYAMSGCTSDPENPSFIPRDAQTTTMNFTPNEGKAFDMESVRVAGDGYQGEEILFDWYPARGLLIVGRVSSAVSISVIARTVDPYAEAGYTEPEDGNGSFDFDGDGVSMSTLPTTSFVSTGFVRIYNPSLQQLSSLASYMWTDQSFIQTLINHAKQLLENPIESIISLNLLPCSIPNGASEEVKVLFIPTGVYMPPVKAQFVEVDCGSVQLTETYGSALDYSPYTKVHCFLPYIGTVTLDTDEVMGKTISIKYRVDIATGVCVAHIMLDGDVYYQFSGHCAVAMPITSADFSSYIAAAIGTAKAVAGIAAAGSGAPGVAAALTGTAAPRSTSSKSSETERNPNTGRQVTTGTASRSTESRGATFGEIAAKAVSNTVGAVMGSKTVVEHSGGFTGNSGYMGVRRPYIVVEIPNIANPRDYSKYNGYPSMITARLGDCTGYTEVQSVQLTGFTATNTELTQIGELLKAGVIL